MYGYYPIGSAPYGAAPPFVAPVVDTAPERSLFLSSRWFDAATVVASSEVGQLYAVNLQDRRPEKKWRGASIAESLTIDLGQPVACNAAAVIGHNLSAGGNLRVKGATSLELLTTTPAVDTGGVSAWPASGKHLDPDWPEETSLVRWSNDAALRYWRIEIADPASALGNVEAGRIMIGEAFQGPFIDSSMGLGLMSPHERARSKFGRTYSDPRGPSSRRLRIPMSAFSESQLERDLFDLARYAGLARDFVFSRNPAATSNFHIFTMQALFENEAEFEALPVWDQIGNVWRTSLSIIEQL